MAVQTQLTAPDARPYYPQYPVLSSSEPFKRTYRCPTLGFTTVWSSFWRSALCLMVQRYAILPPPLGLTPPVPGIEQLYGCQTHSAARHMLGTLGHTPPVSGIEQFLGDQAHFPMRHMLGDARPYYPRYPVLSSFGAQTHPAARHMLGTIGFTTV